MQAHGIDMKNETINKLYEVYKKYVNRNEPDPNSQLCKIWSLDNPPDILEGTSQLESIEETFDIIINEDQAVELFDMSIIQASAYIENLIGQHS